jgi:hypothetical protein
MTLQVGVMHITVQKNVGNSVAHGLAYAQLTLRAAGRGAFFGVSTRHLKDSNCVITREKRVIQHSQYKSQSRIPDSAPERRFAPTRRQGMTVTTKTEAQRKIWTYSERWMVSTR